MSKDKNITHHDIMLVESSSANLLSVPQNLIGLSLVALGTSLPELTISISAARKGRANFVVGNVLGSNIANIFFVF